MRVVFSMAPCWLSGVDNRSALWESKHCRPCTAQVEGQRGLPNLIAKVGKSGPTVLYHGSLAAAAATFVGHYPWFATVGQSRAVTTAALQIRVHRSLRHV
jgi:hypothetical protein